MNFLRTMWLLLVLLPAGVLAADVIATEPDTTILNTRKAWEMVAQARDSAGKERHHEAVADYLEALANDARLVKTVAQEIAYQKLWREDADKAIFYFKRYLARHPDQDNRDVRKGLAQAYSWSGRQKEAIRLYRDLVAEDSSDGSARLGLGRSLIWNNELQEGYAVVRSVEEEFPAGSAPGRESSNFLLTVMDSYTTHLDLRTTASWDSDGLDIYRTTADAHLQVLGNKLFQVAPSVAFFRMPERPGITAPRLQFGLVGTMARNWSFHAYAWVDHFQSSQPISPTATGNLEWTRPGGDLWLTWIALPRLRMDFGGSSMAVETYQAFEKHLEFNQASVSADWRFARNFTLGASGIFADYSDDNTKRRGSTQLYYHREGRLKIITGPSFTYMDFSIPYPGGYWAPDWVRNGSWRLMLETRTHHMTFKLDGSVGIEKELGSEALTVAGVSGHWGWRLGDRTLLAAELGYSRSRFSSASGYNRKFAGLSLKAMF
jgi:Tetratricopeptide repeat